MDTIDDLLGTLPPLLLYVVVATVVATEAAFVAGLLLPAATALVALGLAAHAGTVGPVPAVAVAALAAWLGGTAGYLSGRRNGARARTGRLGRAIGEKRWERAGRFFARHGSRAVFLGTWIAGARTLLPHLAGMNGMPYRTFATRHTPAAFLWASWIVGASYLAGASYDLLAARAGRGAGALAVLVALVAALVLTRRWFGRHPGPVRAVAALLTPRAPRHRRRSLLADVTLGTALLAVAAVVLVVVVPALVRLSGLHDLDSAVARFAARARTADGHRLAVRVATATNPEVLVGLAAFALVVRHYRTRAGGPRRPLREEVTGLLRALGPVLPLSLLGQAFGAVFAPQDVAPPRGRLFPTAPEDLAGPLPEHPTDALSALAGGETAELTAAVGLLAWLAGRRMPWTWRVAVWTAAAVWVTTCACAWVYLGWSWAGETVGAALVGVLWTVLNSALWAPARTVRQPVTARVPTTAPGGRGCTRGVWSRSPFTASRRGTPRSPASRRPRRR